MSCELFVVLCYSTGDGSLPPFPYLLSMSLVWKIYINHYIFFINVEFFFKVFHVRSFNEIRVIYGPIDFTTYTDLRCRYDQT